RQQLSIHPGSRSPRTSVAGRCAPSDRNSLPQTLPDCTGRDQGGQGEVGDSGNTQVASRSGQRDARQSAGARVVTSNLLIVIARTSGAKQSTVGIDHRQL